MSALKTMGIFDQDTYIYYVGDGVVVLKDPIEGDIKVYYKKEAEGKVERAIKMSGMEIVDGVVEKGEYMVQKLRRVSDER